MLKTSNISSAAESVDTERCSLARRRYQKGSVALRGGIWTGRYLEDVHKVNGEVVRVHKRVFLGTKDEIPTKKIAQRKLEPLLSNINSSTYKPKHVVTLSEFLARWEPAMMPQYKPGTQRNFKHALGKYLVPEFGMRQLSDIQPEVLQRFISRTPTGASNIRNIVKCFRAMWRTAKSWGYVNYDPFTDLTYPKIEKTEQRHFSIEEICRILTVASEYHKTLYWILAQTGLRIGEALALTWETVNVHQGVLSVRGSIWRGKMQSGKTAASVRTIPLSPKLQEHLEWYRINRWAENSLSLLFASTKGTPLRADRILSDEFHPLLENLGIPSAGFHAFRHTSATILDQLQAPMKIRQQRLGHANAELTLNTYTHVVTSEAQKVAEQFDGYLLPEKVGV
jgi:integrase